MGSKISLQYGKKFREEIGNGLRLRITRNEDHKPKTRKGNQVMKNQNIQVKPTAGVLLACLAAMSISAPNLASARDQVPFNGVVAGYNNPPSGTECEPIISVVNFGHANQLGAFTGTAEFFPRPCEPNPDLCENNIPYTGTFDWFAANGDEISGTFEGYLCPTETPGVYDNHETAEVTGGSGRFANATGHFELGGQLDFTTNPPSFVLPWQGVISSLGSTRREH
jgi:hypothetical protein